MKKPLLKVAFSTLTAALAVGMFFALGSKSKKPEEAQAVGKDSYWSSWISSHTADLNNTDCQDLVSALKTKITQVKDGNANTISYAGLWEAYKTSDAVPGSESLSKPLIWDMYGGFAFTWGDDQAGSYTNEGDVYNREHSVPKSWFSEKTPAYSDLVHLVPTDGKVNGMRSNYAFGEVSSASYSYSFSARSYNGVQYQNAGISKLGSAKSINGVSCPQTTVFEPDDQYKGDFARIYMYFAVRYGGGTCDAANGAGAAIFSSSLTASNPYVTDYGKELLKKWHVQDPVSTKETNRNDVIEAKQGNRNPFVDYPEWADKIFGSNYEETHGDDTPSISISATSTNIQVNGTATLTATLKNVTGTPSWAITDSSTNVITLSSNSGNSVTVTGKANGTKTVRATVGSVSETIDITVSTKTLSSISVETAPTKTSYTVDEYFDPTGLVINRTYSDNSSDTYTYAGHTSDFTFNPSTSTALTTSHTSVTITYGGKSCNQAITVSTSGGGGGGSGESGSQRIVSNASTTYYEAGAIYPTGSTSSGTASCDAFDVSWLKNSSSNNVLYTYAELRIYSGHSFTITPKTDYTITSIVVTANDDSYASALGGSSLTNCTKSVSGSTVTLTPTNGSSAVGFTQSAQSRVNYMVVNYEYAGSGSTEPTLSSIAVDTAPTKVTYTVGEYFSPIGLVIRRNYSDNSHDTYSYAGHTSEFTFDPSTSTALTTSHTSVIISYGGESCSQAITVTTAAPTSITATVSKSYHPGETISSSDLTVKDNNNNVITAFEFDDDGYRFTYDDANSGGTTTSKTFTNSVSYSNLVCSLTVQVSRVNYVAPSDPVTDTITASDLTATATSYKDFSNVSKSSSARYAGNSAKDSSGNIQMRSGSSSGLVSTTSGGTITSVTITVGSGSNTINVYGSNTAYSSAANLYNSSTQGTLVGSTSSTKTITFTTGYAYVGIRSNSGAVYLRSIAINYGSEDTAVNVSNYIMYTDTTNQCTTKYSVAKGYFQGLSTSERATFMTSNEYVVSTARERLEAWARYHGETISLSNGDYVVSKVSVLNPFINSTNNNTLVIIIIVSAISVSIIGAYFFIRRRKEI